jgi:hypothetical protein
MTLSGRVCCKFSVEPRGAPLAGAASNRWTDSAIRDGVDNYVWNVARYPITRLVATLMLIINEGRQMSGISYSDVLATVYMFHRFGWTCCVHLQERGNKIWDSHCPNKIRVLWYVTPFSFVDRFHRFGGACCLHLHGGIRFPLIVRTHLSYYTTSQPKRQYYH